MLRSKDKLGKAEMPYDFYSLVSYIPKDNDGQADGYICRMLSNDVHDLVV